MNACTHHWLLGTIAGADIAAVCKNCGQRKTFPAAPQEISFGRKPLRKRGATMNEAKE